MIGEEKRIADIEKNVFEHLVGQVLSFKMSKPIVGAFRVAASKALAQADRLFLFLQPSSCKPTENIGPRPIGA